MTHVLEELEKGREAQQERVTAGQGGTRGKERRGLDGEQCVLFIPGQERFVLLSITQ